MAVTWSSSTCTITSGTYTLDQLWDDAGNVGDAYLVKSGTNPYTYAFATGWKLSLSSGVLNMSNAGDTLTFDPSASDTVEINVSSGSVLTVAAGCTINFDKDATYYGYANLYGDVTLSGTSGSHIVIKNFDILRVYLYGQITSPVGQNWTYVDLQDPQASDSYFMYFYNSSVQYSDYTACSFNHITMTTSAGNRGYGMFMAAGPFSNITFNDITMTDLNYPLHAMSTVFKMSNSTIQQCYGASPLVRCPVVLPSVPYDHSKTDKWTNKKMGQPKITFDTCTFNNNYNSTGTTYGMYSVSAGAVAKFDTCTFTTASYGIRTEYNGIALIHNCTFTSISTANFVWGGDATGVILHVWELNLTVQDTSGNVISGAHVCVYQNEGKEHWEFYTNASGVIEDIWGDPPVFAEKEETATSTYTQWSNSISGGQFHWVVVSKPGFQTWKRKVEFTADRTITAKLVAETGSRSIYQ